MIDQYFYVKADRVSPEFPIPVLEQSATLPASQVPGGAGNVCMQLRPWNCEVYFHGFLDTVISGLLSENGIWVNGTYLPNHRAVPQKRRYYSGDFPLCRLDIEQPNYGLSNAELRAIQRALFSQMTQMPPTEVVILSDYGKGVFNGDAAPKMWLDYYAASELCPITIVDPKGGPASRWKGCSIIKPNSKEAAEMSGTNDWQKQCAYFMEECACQAVVITQQGDGVVGNVLGREFEYRPVRNVKAESVIGAGDCFVSVLALSMAYGLDIVDAVEIAFEAGHIYVQRKHNRPVGPQELMPKLASKIVPAEDLAVRDFKLSFTNGVFDLLHPGHINTLEFAKSKGEKLVVGVNTDASAKRLNKNHDLVNELGYRMKMLAALECVDFVVEFDEDTPYNLIKTIRPDVLVKGAEYENPVGSDVVSEVYPAPMLDGFSTSNLIKKIKNA